MITVMVRHVLDEDGLKLGEFDITEIQQVYEVAKTFGVYLDGSQHDHQVGKVLTGQFVVSKDKRYFEIIVE